MFAMSPSIIICIVALCVLLWLLRRSQISFGLPLAYLYLLLLNHVPGGFAHIVGADFLRNSELTALAMKFTAIGSASFVGGVWFALATNRKEALLRSVDRPQFWWFCVIGGWIFVFGLFQFTNIPSLGAAIDKGGAIWMLGALLGLRAAVQRRDIRSTTLWFIVLIVYPLMMLFFAAFLSYGSAAIILVCSVLTISTRSYRGAAVGIVIFTFVSLSIFVNYFEHRPDIRKKVWGGASLDARIDSVTNVVRDFEWFDPSNRQHLIDLDQRLNQNYFIGLAARRIEQGHANYLYGESVWEGGLALVPRVLWPEKPVFAGSPQIVAKMTGLHLSQKTSFGVGNVMEFYINFGVPGVVVGFLILGLLIGKLDYKAAFAENRGDMGAAIVVFLPAVALIDPGGSLVEISSGAAAALIAALFWNVAWKKCLARRSAARRPTLTKRPDTIANSAYSH